MRSPLLIVTTCNARRRYAAKVEHVVQCLKDGAVEEKHDAVGHANRDDFDKRRALERFAAVNPAPASMLNVPVPWPRLLKKPELSSLAHWGGRRQRNSSAGGPQGEGACNLMRVISCVEVRDPHWIAVGRVADVCERPLCMSYQQSSSKIVGSAEFYGSGGGP
jgi:hypothetical protein